MEQFFLFSLFLYLLSLLLTVAGSRTDLKFAHLAALLSYAAGSLVTAAILASRISGSSGWHLTYFFDGVLLTLTLLALVYGITRIFVRMRLASAILSAVSLALGVMALVRARSVAEAQPAGVIDGLLTGHIICMFTALAAFTLSFIFSILFLIQDRMIKQRAFGAHLSVLPSLELTARMNFAAVTVGTAALAMGVLGGTRALHKISHPLGAFLDPTVILSVLMLALYGVLVGWRWGARSRSRTVAVISAAFYLLMLFVFWGAHASG